MYPIFRDLRQFLLIVTLTSEVLSSNLQLYTLSFGLTCSFYKVFGRDLLCCVRIGLDWIQRLGHQLDWTGLGSVPRRFGLDWIVSTQSISYSSWKVWYSEGQTDRKKYALSCRYQTFKSTPFKPEISISIILALQSYLRCSGKARSCLIATITMQKSSTILLW